MSDRHTYRFVIDGWTPATLPMARLAEYLSDLAKLFGHARHVHFDRLEPGSAALVQHVDDHAVAGVRERLEQAKAPHPPDVIAQARDAIERRLAEDDATASLSAGGGAELLRFAGCEQRQEESIGPFWQDDDALYGRLIRVGGRSDPVPVHLEDRRKIHQCRATRQVACGLAPHLYGSTLRVHGRGQWERRGDGVWLMHQFDIREFEELDDTPLPQVVERLQSIPGSGWPGIEDQAAELRRLRGHDEDEC